MSKDKVREEFERTNDRDHRRQPPKGNNYIDPMAQADWESFQKGWDQSREALVIELPEGESLFQRMYGVACERPHLIERKHAVAAIEAAGVKVKP